MPQIRPTSVVRNPDELTKYAVVDEGGLGINLFVFLSGVHGGIRIRSAAAGAAELEIGRFGGNGVDVHRIPASLVKVPDTRQWVLLERCDAIALMISAVRICGVSAYSFMWTRRTEPVFCDALHWSGPLMGHVPWQLSQAFRVGRADLWEAVSSMMLQLIARVPDAYRLAALCEHTFETGGWEMNLATANRLLKRRGEWAILAVECSSETARLYVCGVPLFVSMRDWALLALYLLTTERDLARSIPQLIRPLAISERRR
jgi:hypothetical protein